MPTGVPRPYNPHKQAKAKAILVELSIPIDGLPDERCVYKLHYAGRYVIHKCLSLSGSIYNFKRGYAYFIGYEHKEADAHRNNKYFSAIYRHIQAHPGHQFKIEILAQGTPYHLLKAEQIALNEVLKDKSCLNTNIDAYIPQYRPKTKNYGGWISRSDYMNFKKWIKAQSQ